MLTNLFSSVQSLSCVRLFATSWIAARLASLSITNSWSSLKFMSIESVMPSSHLILCRPFLLLPQSLPASEPFPVSQLFAWGGQSIGVSASTSVLPMNTQDWSPLEWTSWISLQSKGLSRVFSNNTVQKHQFFGTQPPSQSNSHIHTWGWYNYPHCHSSSIHLFCILHIWGLHISYVTDISQEKIKYLYLFPLEILFPLLKGMKVRHPQLSTKITSIFYAHALLLNFHGL